MIDRVPVLITQHMPPTFTTILAEHLARASGRPAHEPTDGEAGRRRHHLSGARRPPHARREARREIPSSRSTTGRRSISASPRSIRCSSSAVEFWGNAILAVILTGMGHDGTRGAGDIVAQGGSVIAQDEATSVVWGMPGSAANAGVCSAVLPIDQIAPKIVRLFQGDRA